MTRILLVEDTPDYAAMLRDNLAREGFDVIVAASGTDGLERARRDSPDLVVLDLMLPGMNGYTVLQRLRDEGREMPVLIMTARSQEDDKLRGFDLGADDYIVKPCGLREILARVRALLRRGATDRVSARPVTRIQDLEIDLAARTVKRGATLLSLRAKELDLLAALLRHRGSVVSRDVLLREVWGYARGSESRTVETHIAALRQHLGDSTESPRYVITVRGKGYRVD